MTTKVDAGELIRLALDSRLRDVWTCFPATVKAYNAAEQTADLIPVVRGLVPGEDGGLAAEDLPVLPDVPIMFPRGGGGSFAITWPLEAGDPVMVHVTTVSSAGWRRTGEASDPGDLRTHHLGNAWAVPGPFPSADKLDQAADSALVIEGTAIKLGKNATEFVAMANKVMANFNALVTTLGSGTAGGDPVTFGSPFSPENVASGKVKVEE